MEQQEQTMVVKENVADPTPLGLLGLGIVCFCVSTSRLGWSSSATAAIIPWVIFLGATAQLIASYFDFKKNNPFGSVVFGAYGLFWAAMAMVWLIAGKALGPNLHSVFDIKQLGFAFLGYLLFSLFGTVAAMRTNTVVFLIMVLIDVLFAGLTFDIFKLGGTWAFSMAAWSELFISLLGLYGSGAILVNQVFGRTVFPMGSPIIK